MKEIIINCHPRETRIAVVVDGKLDQYSLERAETLSPVGSIYKGRVTNILRGLEAAFVDIGLEKDGFLSMGEMAESSSLSVEFDGVPDSEKGPPPPRRPGGTIEKLLHRGQEILVQVTKEPIGEKGARLTTQISLPGRYLVLMPQERHLGISRRIVDREERRRLHNLLAELKVPPGIGVIARTAAAKSTFKDLKRDLKYLLDIWQEVQKEAGKSSAPVLVREELSLVMKSIRDLLLSDVDRIWVDSKAEFKKISRFLEGVSPQMKSRIIFYSEPQPLFEKYGLEGEIEKIYRPQVWLKCGGYIVFNQTEALVAVDVNTGRHKGKRGQEETALKTNLEAAEEVAKQLRLRNVGGIIVIDFIDLGLKKHQKQVMSVLLRELKKDKAKTKVLPFSEFGLVQLTRQREQESYQQKLSETCPYCNGLGVVKSFFSLALDLERKLTSARTRRPEVKRFRIEAHPHLARYLLEEGWENLRSFAHENKIRLSVIDNASLKAQEYILWALVGEGQEKV